MSDAQELGELLGALIARSDQPNINLNVPDVHVVANLDPSGLSEALRAGVDANGAQFRAAVDAFKAAVVALIGERSSIDFGPVVEALERAGEASTTVDYSRLIKSMIVAIEAQTAAQKDLATMIENSSIRIEKALKAGKTITYDDKGRVSSVRAG